MLPALLSKNLALSSKSNLACHVNSLPTSRTGASCNVGYHRPNNGLTRFSPLFRNNRRCYAGWSIKSKKAKESIASKLKNWSDKGLLKSAAQISSPTLVSTSLSSLVAQDLPDASPSPDITSTEPEKPLTLHELQLKEYVELCRDIIEGKQQIVEPAPKKTSKSSKSKAAAENITSIESSTPNEAQPPKKSTRAKKKLESAASASTEITIPQEPNISISQPIEVVLAPKKRSKSMKQAQEVPLLVAEEVQAPSTPTATTAPAPSLPLNWQHDFEMDLSPIRTEMTTLMQEFDASLRSEPNFDQHAPLGFLPLRFWQSRFDWDQQVEKAAKKYVLSATMSKQLLDPSFKPSRKDEDASEPVTFKQLQREAINIALADRNEFVALPTGGGKTMVYVLPSLLEKGITVVISPLIALIQDQVTLLESMGIGAAGISCQMSPEHMEAVYDELLSSTERCRFKLIYVTPERIGRNERFVKILEEMNRRGMLQRVVVDEAHCISEWGHDFRPDYRRLKVLKEVMPSLPIMALTGTCTPAVRKDIAEQLGIAMPQKEPKKTSSKLKASDGALDGATIGKKPSLKELALEKLDDGVSLTGDANGHYVLQTSFNRPNLWFQISSKSPETPMGDMLYYILNQRLAHECGIIYAMTTSDAERLSDFFAQQGILTTFYHGGMTPQARQESHARWARGEAKLMCTTVAFGLGIDKSNVRYVLHSTMPTSLEAYYQQAGRAGRDGNAADCVMFFEPKDRIKIEYVIKLNAHFLRQREKKAELAKQQQRLLDIQKKEMDAVTKKKRGQSKKAPKLETPTLAPGDPSGPNSQANSLESNLVDIVDIDDIGLDGSVRVVNDDGSEFFFEGFHPDYNGQGDLTIEEENPLDEFVRLMKTEKLDDVSSYAREKRTCRRVHLMRFFGQENFTSHQCEHSCDICSPKARRVTDRLTKHGKEEWESLATQREARLKELQERASKPLASAVAKIHDLIHVQEQDMAREAAADAAKREEEEYEAQFERKKRAKKSAGTSSSPSMPSKLGASSPLAKKMRKGRSMSSLGDPDEYEQFQQRLLEDLKAVSAKRVRKIVQAPSPAPTSDLVALLLESRPKPNLTPTLEKSPESPSQEGMQDLFARIAAVTEQKALRRQQALSKKRGSGSAFSSAKRHIMQSEDEDGYIRTTTIRPAAFGPGESALEDDDLLPSSLSSPLVAAEPVVPGLPQLSPSSTLATKDRDEDLSEDEAEEVEKARAGATQLVSSRLNHKMLLEVRQACRRISNEKDILPKSVMSQSTMKALVRARPKSVLQLASVKGVGPGRAQRYAAYLLPIFEKDDEL